MVRHFGFPWYNEDMASDVIGIFDSGIGGLAIWRAISQRAPQYNTIYVADQAYFPYGEKTRVEILKRSLRITRWLLDQGASLIVVACNSATVAAIDILRLRFNIPFVGVEPAIKPAVRMSRTGEITVLATTTTLRSPRQRDLMTRHADGIKVHLVSIPKLVELLESGETQTPRMTSLLRSTLSPERVGRSDVFVLGCTHYIFLKHQIQRQVRGVKVIEPSVAVTRRVKSLLPQGGRAPKIRGEYCFLTTGVRADFAKRAQLVLGMPLTSVKEVKL